MRSSLRERWSAWKYSAQRSLAPHVEEAWAEDFVVELRLQGVSGPEIGAALSEVESHCVESSERALDAFGDPVGYARGLRLARSPDDTPGAIAASITGTVVQLGAMLLTIWAFSDRLDGSDLTITSGRIVSLVLLLAAIAGVVRFSEQALRFIVARPVVAFLTFMAAMPLSVVALVLGTHELATVPAVPALATGTALLVVGSVWQWHRTRTGADEDVITSPLEEAPATTRPTSRWAALTYLAIPVYTALSLALSWWIAQQ